MTSIRLDKKSQDILDDALEAATKEPVRLQKDGEDVAVLLSPKMFAFYAGKKQEGTDSFLNELNQFRQEAKDNGMTEEVLADLLADDA